MDNLAAEMAVTSNAFGENLKQDDKFLLRNFPSKAGSATIKAI